MSLHLLISPEDLDLIGEKEAALITHTYASLFAKKELQVEVSCVTPEEIAQLNKAHRNLDEPTDVLSFPIFHTLAEIRAQPDEAPVLIGSIVICPEKATLYSETLPQLLHHGLLHLIGFDHEQDFGPWAEEEGWILSHLADHGLFIEPVSHDSF